MTFINAKGNCTHGYTVDNDDLAAYDKSWEQLPSSGTRGDDFDLMEHVLNSFSEFFDDPNNGIEFIIEVDEVHYNYNEFTEYLKNINSTNSLEILREGF